MYGESNRLSLVVMPPSHHFNPNNSDDGTFFMKDFKVDAVVLCKLGNHSLVQAVIFKALLGKNS